MNTERKKQKYKATIDDTVSSKKQCCYTCGHCGYSEKRKEYYCRLRTLVMSGSSATKMLCLDDRWEGKDEH